jgi:ABC-2 type transport system permease protein
MTHILDLALKDLLQIARDKKSAIFLVAMPIFFTVFLGFISGSSGKKADPRLPVGVVNRDAQGSVSASFLTLLEEAGAVRPVILEGKKAEQAPDLVRDEKLAAAVVIPDGWSQRAWEGQELQVQVIVDQNATAGRAASNALYAVVSRLRAGLRIAQLSAEAASSQAAFASQSARQAYLEDTLVRTVQAWKEPPLAVAVERSGAAQKETVRPGSRFLQSSPGMIVQFTINGMIMAATGIVLERKTRTLQRLLTTSVTRVQIVLGKLLGMVILVFAQQLLLIFIGQFALGVGYLRQPLAILLVVSALAIWVGALGLLIGAVSKGEEQVIMWTLMAMFILTAMGGAWFPLEVTGKVFSTIGHLLPSAWAMDGFQNIVLRGLGLPSVLLPTIIMLGYAALFFGLAVWRFRFE